jgi:hypothetical protein
MKAILKRLPTPSMLIACVALTASLGGVSYAAGVLPKNSVGTTQLQKKAVTASKLKKNAVTGVKVKNGTLRAADFGAGQLPAGPRGAQGPKGDKGDPGAAGGFNGYQLVSDMEILPAGGSKLLVATCPAGKKAIGGGYSSGFPVEVERSYPANNGTAWDVWVNDTDNAAQGVAVWAICANVG